MQEIKSDFIDVVKGGLKFMLMGGLMVGVAGVVIWDVVKNGDLCTETSMVEWGQFVMILLSSILFAVLAAKRPVARAAYVLVSTFFLDMAIRELDYLFEKIYPTAWAVPVTIVTVAAFVYAFLHRDSVLPGLAHIARSNYFILLMMGITLLLGFSRLMGYKGIWHAVFANNHTFNWHIIKRIVEESLELLAYTIIFGASVLITCHEFKGGTKCQK